MNQDPPPEYLLWLLMIVLAVAIVFLPGCSQIPTKEFRGICAMQPVAQDGNIIYFNYHCRPEE